MYLLHNSMDESDTVPGLSGSKTALKRSLRCTQTAAEDCCKALVCCRHFLQRTAPGRIYDTYGWESDFQRVTMPSQCELVGVDGG